MNNFSSKSKIKKTIYNIKTTDKKKQRIHYSLITVLLVICIAQLTFSSIQNINKTFSFKSKIKGLEHKRDEEFDKNRQLKSDIENFNSQKSLESIVRNNLKMAGKDEILIIINKPVTTKEEEIKVNNKKNNRTEKPPLN